MPASSLYADDPRWVIVALGDSITAGAPGFISPLEYPPHGRGNEESQYSYWIMQKHPDWRVINQGISGERTDQMLARFESDVLSHQPDIVIVLGGGSDLSQGYGTAWVKRHLARIYRRALHHKINVLACTILPFSGTTPGMQERMKEVNKWILAYSEGVGAGYCNTYKAMEDNTRPGRLINTADGLHPDVKGYQRLGRAIAECLEEWISEIWGP